MLKKLECSVRDASWLVSVFICLHSALSIFRIIHVSFTTVFLSDLEHCEPGWDKFHGFCYRHFSQRLSWEVAEQHCRMQGAHLVSIMTPEEQNYINSRFTAHICLYRKLDS